METFSFATSAALKDQAVYVRIDRLDGHHKSIPYSELLARPNLRHRASNTNPHSELYVTVQVWADSKPLTVPVQTAYKPFKNARVWNEWIALPITYSNLALSAQLAVTIWDLSPAEAGESNLHAIPFGGTTIPLFDDDNTLQKGRQRCRIHRHKCADGLSSSTTPWVLSPTRKGRSDTKTPDAVNSHVAEMQRLETLLKQQEMGDIPQNNWLDQMVFRKMMKLRHEALKAEAASQRNASRVINGDSHDGSTGPEELFYLDIELPRFDHPIVFADVEYPPVMSQGKHALDPNNPLRALPEVHFGPGIDADGNAYGGDAGHIIRIYDPEVGQPENPAEMKHRRLIRSMQTGAEREMKPSPPVRDQLNRIMSYGPLHNIALDEKDLIWKFRYYLLRDKRALTKFVKSTNWREPNEAKQAAPLLSKWAEIDVDDALELLGPQVEAPTVRAYAVERLKKADDDELLVYLLQLVQALKFEARTSEIAETDSAPDSSLAQFLVNRAANSFTLGNFLHWYLTVEIDDHSPDQIAEYRKVFAKVEYDLFVQIESRPDGEARKKTFLRQAEFIAVISKISKDIRLGREDRQRKIVRLKKLLADPKNDLLHIDPPLPLPLDPAVSITGIVPEEASVLKSSLLPLLLTFRTNTNTKYQIMFKTGDDLRQDQLVIQIITLMDRLLRKENLDLKLSPYRILATSTSAGAVQFLSAMSLSGAVNKYKGSLLAYLRANNPDESADLGVRKEAMDTFVKSCAGYCVITYLLGVGDRHLENLLISPAGHFFHVDFGYILGRDPKPFAPQMKLCKEMIEGMGGIQHPNYQRFKQFCFTAYSTLRKSSNLILNLFALMRDANIPDIAMERDRAVQKVQERLWLDLSEDEAMKGFDRLIEESKDSWMPMVIDRVHGFVQHWRA